jgi:branched-chain amino acid transport system ATP-binding protein
MPTSEPLLEIDGLAVRYGRVRAVEPITLSVRAGEVLALLGANGAGKTSLMNAACGVVPAAEGSVRLRGESVVQPPSAVSRWVGASTLSHRVIRAGVALVPEGRQVVAPLSVLENLELAGGSARRRRGRAAVRQGIDEVFELFPRLRERSRQQSGLLSGGEQQMLAIGRGIMASPDVLFVDEPSMGLAPIMVAEIYEMLSRRDGTLGRAALVLAEQSTPLALKIATDVCVLSRGTAVYSGPASELTERVMHDAYLGVANAE